MTSPLKTKRKRLHCQFNSCSCSQYHGKRDSQCKRCNHGDVWHKLVYVEIKKEKEYEEHLNDVPN